MSEFATSGSVVIEIDQGSLRDARKDVEQSIGSVTVDANAQGGRGVGRTDGGSSTLAMAGGASVIDELSDQTEYLSDILDELEKQGASGGAGGGGGGLAGDVLKFQGLRSILGGTGIGAGVGGVAGGIGAGLGIAGIFGVMEGLRNMPKPGQDPAEFGGNAAGTGLASIVGGGTPLGFLLSDEFSSTFERGFENLGGMASNFEAPDWLSNIGQQFEGLGDTSQLEESLSNIPSPDWLTEPPSWLEQQQSEQARETTTQDESGEFTGGPHSASGYDLTRREQAIFNQTTGGSFGQSYFRGGPETTGGADISREERAIFNESGAVTAGGGGGQQMRFITRVQNQIDNSLDMSNMRDLQNFLRDPEGFMRRELNLDRVGGGR